MVTADLSNSQISLRLVCLIASLRLIFILEFMKI